MSGYQQTALILSGMSRQAGESGFVSVFEHLVEYHNLDPDLENGVGRLEFECSSLEWAGTERVEVREQSLRQLIRQEQWLRIRADIRIARKLHGAEIYSYPISNEGGRTGLMLRLESSAYLAVYGDRLPHFGLYDEEARDGLIALCLGVTLAAGSDGFLYDFDPGKPTRLTVEELQKRLLHPVFEKQDPEHGHPGLIAGIKTSITPKRDLDLVWRPENIHETTTGYAYLALLWPPE